MREIRQLLGLIGPVQDIYVVTHPREPCICKLVQRPSLGVRWVSRRRNADTLLDHAAIVGDHVLLVQI